MNTVLINNNSPLITFRILFNTGAADDPKGKEGLAFMTASLLSNGGNLELSYEQIVKAMYPMATSFEAQIDKEMTVFIGTTHVNNLQSYYKIISGMLLNPGWREDDFNRVKEAAINYLRINLRNHNDEELGKEELYNFIYRGTSWGHHNVGTIESLKNLTPEDLKNFYRDRYNQKNLVIGLAGGYAASFLERVKNDFATLPIEADDHKRDLQCMEPIQGLQMEVIERQTRATAISFGFPLPVTRGGRDWVALKLVESYLGQHRSSNSHLYQVMRHIRGLNYGDYAYIEYFPRGMFLMQPEANLARRQQIFQIWVRPVEHENTHFALRLAMYELRRLVDDGILNEEFEQTRQFLSKFVKMLTKTQSAQLGYALDSHFYGIPDFNQYMREGLAALKLEDVNAAIKKYLNYQNIKFVIVTKKAAELKNVLLGNRQSPMNYGSAKPQSVLDEDKIIESLPLNFKTENIRIVPVDHVFQT